MAHANTKGSRIARMLAGTAQRVSPRMRRINAVSMVVAVLLTVVTLVVLHLVLETQRHTNQTNAAYQESQAAVNDLGESSDFLTSEAREYVVSGERAHLDNYLAEVGLYDRRGKALANLRECATSDEAVQALEMASVHSSELEDVELYAMRLAADARGLRDLPQELLEVQVSDGDTRLSTADRQIRAYDLVYGTEYLQKKLKIRDNIQTCNEVLVNTLRNELENGYAQLEGLLTAMRTSVVLLLCVMGFAILSSTILVLWPIAQYEENIREDQPLEPIGALELRHLTQAYNDMYAQNHDRAETLDYEAHNDALTGVLNRGSFDTLLTKHKGDCALVLVDIDYFKQFNDEYGHDMGDAILIEVAATLYASFRSTDFVCRIGGDEFAIIAPNMNVDMQPVIEHKLKKAAAFLRDDSNGLPPATVSVGVAFGELGCSDDGLFQKADAALYETKRRGRDGYTFQE